MQLLFLSLLEASEVEKGFNLENHTLYPKISYQEEDLMGKLKNKELDMAFIQKTPDDNNFDNELEYTLIGKEALVCITSFKNTVNDIQKNQIEDMILNNNHYNWSDLGGKRGDITLLRDMAYTNGYNLLSQCMFNGKKLPDIKLTQEQISKFFPYNSKINVDRAAVYQETTDYVLDFAPFFRLMFIEHSNGGENEYSLKLMSIDGKKVKIEDVLNDKYPYFIKSYIVTRKGEKLSIQLNEIKNYLVNVDDNVKIVSGMGRLNMTQEEIKYMSDTNYLLKE